MATDLILITVFAALLFVALRWKFVGIFGLGTRKDENPIGYWCAVFGLVFALAASIALFAVSR
jgi:hypothetical protein